MTQPSAGLNPSPAPNPAASDFERIVPQRRDTRASGGVQHAPMDAATRVSAQSFWIALLGLLLFGALLFWWLPGLLSPPQPTPAVLAPPNPTAPATTAVTSRPDTAAGWSDPVLLADRAAAQESRSKYEAERASLLARGAEHWAASELVSAAQQASAGATAFASKEYAAAAHTYSAAAATTAALLAGIPQRLSAALAEGARALEAADKAHAQAAYERALALDPNHAQARRGLERVASLDALRAKLDTARRLEQADDLAGARRAYAEALVIDADSSQAREALARLDAQAADQDFARTLGAALSALDRGAYDEAERQIHRARALRANDPALKQASARLAEARRGQTLAALEREAGAQRASENWAGAVASYQRALQLDPSLAFASEGLAQAEPRAQLAQRLQDAATRPERLASAAVMQEAVQLLEQGRAVADAGPRHREHLAALARVIAAAATPVAVTLSSDGQTEVTLYTQGTLGRFARQELALKPGRYVAIGARDGYRDVREEFEVRAGAQNVRVDIRCKDPL